MLLPVLSLIGGFVLLAVGADRFVLGAASVARNLGVSPLLTGLTIVGFGTSAPEMLVAGYASVQGTPALAVGNALGSNVANIGLVLGATAMVCPLTVGSRTVRTELPVMLLAMGAVYFIVADDHLSRTDGLALAGGLIGLLLCTVWIGLRAKPGDPLMAEYAAEGEAHLTMRASIGAVVLGLVLLLIGSDLLVDGGVAIARALGVSELVIGLTIVAIGTSLPELAASIMSAVHREPDIAIGNVIGSNMFNVLGVMSLPGLIAPSALEPAVRTRDYPVMLLLSLALVLVSFRSRGPGRINRLEGAILFAGFCGYQYLLYRTSGAAL